MDPSNERQLDQDALDQLSLQLCPRRSGVGAVGLITMDEGSNSRLLFSSPKLTQVPLDALFAVARWLLDSGRFGLNTLKLECRSESFALEPIDSRHFRISIAPPTWQRQPLPDGVHHSGLQTLDIEGRSYSVFPVESRDDFLVYLHTPEELVYPELKALQTKAEERQRTALRLTPLAPGEIRLDGIGIKDGITAAACGGLAARILGLTSEEVLVKMGGNPYFVQVQPDRRVDVTTTSAYVFSGQWSPQ